MKKATLISKKTLVHELPEPIKNTTKYKHFICPRRDKSALMSKWLNSKVNDQDILSTYEPTEMSLNPLQKYYLIDNLSLYYYPDDDDLSCDESFLPIIDPMDDGTYVAFDDYDKNISDYLSIYTERYRPEIFFNNKSAYDKLKQKDEKNVLILPHTNRYHTSHLFKGLVNYCNANGCFYPKFEEEGDDFSLFDLSMKKAFYEFCYNNTHKNKMRY
jgi:hypothetical protein